MNVFPDECTRALVGSDDRGAKLVAPGNAILRNNIDTKYPVGRTQGQLHDNNNEPMNMEDMEQVSKL